MMLQKLRVKSSAAPAGGLALDLSPLRDGDLNLDLDLDLDRDWEQERELSLLLSLMVVLLGVVRVMVGLVVKKLGVLGKL